MDSRFAGAWLKVDRAKEHIRQLNDAITAYGKGKPYKLVVEQDPQSANHLWTIRRREGVPKDLPNDIPLVTGDAIHSLRSAVDHLIYRAVVLNGKTPIKMTAFPFPGEAESLEAAIKRRHVQDAGPNVLDVVRRLEPQMAEGQALRAVHDLDITDKHKTVLPVTFFGGLLDLQIMSGNQMMMTLLGVRRGPLYDSMNVLNIPAVSNVKIGQEFDAPVEVRMPEGGFAQYESLVPTLQQLTQLVEGMVKTFDALPPFP